MQISSSEPPPPPAALLRRGRGAGTKRRHTSFRRASSSYSGIACLPFKGGVLLFGRPLCIGLPADPGPPTPSPPRQLLFARAMRENHSANTSHPSGRAAGLGWTALSCTTVLGSARHPARLDRPGPARGPRPAPHLTADGQGRPDLTNLGSLVHPLAARSRADLTPILSSGTTKEVLVRLAAPR